MYPAQICNMHVAPVLGKVRKWLKTIQSGRFIVTFYPSARWAQRGIVVPFVRRRRRTHSFGYYTNIVQQIKFIIHTNIQPLPALFFTQGQGHRSKVKVKDLKKILLTR